MEIDVKAVDFIGMVNGFRIARPRVYTVTRFDESSMHPQRLLLRKVAQIHTAYRPYRTHKNTLDIRQ
jgi:hypothetical protein